MGYLGSSDLQSVYSGYFLMYVFPGLWFVFLLCLRCSHWFKMSQFCMITEHPHRVEPEEEDGGE